MHDDPRPGSIPAAAEERAARDAFESVMRLRGLDRAPNGEYRNTFLQEEWEVWLEAWQARAALAAPKAEAWHFTRDGRFPPPDSDVLVWSQQSWEKEPSLKLDRWAEQHEAPVEWSSQTIPTGMGWDAHGDPFDVIAWMLPAPPTSPAPQEES